ncbi:DUF4123 domain-containing protein [Eleftheria terrae]|uniref:DUF4123 domain-containing protein n=1 Tax=Eleftheria terrae TaxID=1597781 RepID=UPI00263B0AB9|nr:DUF4123 domain-containing protein [Eleftheria terrae]WKB53800.1 DUF4123 domain-containing protein [Eleftheria terrae]
MLDTARDRAIEPLLRASGLPRECLLAGALSARLLAVAPYVVQLDVHEGGQWLQLLTAVWGGSRGWLAVTRQEVGLALMRRHLRSLLLVPGSADDGPSLLRFFDPRVLRVLLPHSTSAQAERFMGPMACVLVESSASNDAQLCGMGPRPQDVQKLQGLPQLRVFVERAMLREAPLDVRLPPAGGWVLKLTPQQLHALTQDASDRFAERLAHELRRAWPRACEGRSTAELQALVRQALIDARRLELQSLRSLSDYVGLAFRFGLGFEEHPAVRRLLEPDDRPVEQRLARLFLEMADGDWADLQAGAAARSARREDAPHDD